MDIATTETSSLTSEASLTRLHRESDLPGTHASRRTNKGFLLSDARLAAYEPTLPGKLPVRSWCWDEGEAITKSSTGESLWLCRHCFDKKEHSKVFTRPAHTTRIIRHLGQHGFRSDGTERSVNELKRKRTQETMLESLQRQSEAQRTTFSREAWESAFVAWTVNDDVGLRKTTTPWLRSLITYRNSFLDAVIPQSANTTRRWIIKTFKASKSAVRRSLATARSRVTLSFDGWLSDNGLDLLGVFAHYIDNNYVVKNVLLGLRNTYGAHTGEEQCRHLKAIAREYKISNKIAYFMADNASANDTALELLQYDLDIHPKKSRLRCAGHIINLVCKSILFGTDVDCINDVLLHAADGADSDLSDGSVSQFEQLLHSQSKDELAVLKAWRKKGPVGKLHNIILHARSSEQRRNDFRRVQREADPDRKRLYQLVINGGIRWNSTFDMIDRAFKLMASIELYQHEYRTDPTYPLADDLLTHDDWQELKDIHSLLEPLKYSSMRVQASGKDGIHGSLFESLQVIDYLLTKLETLKKEHHHQADTHFKASINLGWKKLNKYYSLSDSTPAYRAAIALHPAYKMHWFHKQWSKEHPLWIDDARDKIYALYKEYERCHGDELGDADEPALPVKELTEFERYNVISDNTLGGNELERFLSESIEPPSTNPLTWWRNNHKRYPILRHMAFDLLAAPASSSAAERQFSTAGHILNDEHWCTMDDLAEATQCLKSIYSEGIDVTAETGKLGRRRR